MFQAQIQKHRQVCRRFEWLRIAGSMRQTKEIKSRRSACCYPLRLRPAIPSATHPYPQAAGPTKRSSQQPPQIQRGQAIIVSSSGWRGLQGHTQKSREIEAPFRGHRLRHDQGFEDVQTSSIVGPDHRRPCQSAMAAPAVTQFENFM